MLGKKEWNRIKKYYSKIFKNKNKKSRKFVLVCSNCMKLKLERVDYALRISADFKRA